MKGLRSSKTPRRQRGQALAFATLFLVAVLLVMLTMYSVGQLAIEKMRLQNTADAAAYSAALEQARDYNFSAYTNRAMIANQVAVAQVVGMTSWARNYSDVFSTLTPEVEWMAQGVVADIMWTPEVEILGPIANGLKSFMNAYGPVSAGILNVLIDGLGFGQQVFHYGTALTVAQTLGVLNQVASDIYNATGFDISGLTNIVSDPSYDIIQKNDPDAHLSNLGVAAFVYNTVNWLGFTKQYDPTANGGTGDGASPNDNRFAHVAVDSMDGFYKQRTRPYVPFPWPLPSVFADPTYIVGGPMVYGFTMLLFHNGGTELKNNNKTWSAMDVTSFFGLVTVPIYIPPFGPFLNLPILPWLVPPLGSGAGGAAQVGSSSNLSGSGNNFDDYADAYGKSYSANAIAAAEQEGKGAGSTMGLAVPSSSGGLRKYYDVKDVTQATDADHHSDVAPAIMIEVVKPSSSLLTASAAPLNIGKNTAPDAATKAAVAGGTLHNALLDSNGNASLDVGDGTASNVMKAISQGEAYFSRPPKLWPRDNSKEVEYGSLYNPYWQARLVTNDLVEQGLSLAFQGLLTGTSIPSWAQ